MKNKVSDLVYADLSYRVTGVLFRVQNNLGTKFQEKHIQKAIEIELNKEKINFKREAKIEVIYEGEKLGDFFADFIIENKIILEVKSIWKITDNDIKQLKRYLESRELKLGIIANFKFRPLRIIRVLNPKIHSY